MQWSIRGSITSFTPLPDNHFELSLNVKTSIKESKHYVRNSEMTEVKHGTCVSNLSLIGLLVLLIY